MSSKTFGPPVVMGNESIMSQKAHGTCDTPVQDDLLWDVSRQKADQICCYNRHYAEHSGYFLTSGVTWVEEARKSDGPMHYYDSVSGKLLFTAPIGRTFDQFLQESRAHGWPSFRDEEVEWKNVRCLPGGEAVSVDGTHLGHNIPDGKGNRYCINLVSIAGRRTEKQHSEL